jgi:hypothetical protein
MNVTSPEWKTVADIPRFPFETFDQMQAAVAIKSFNVGVEPLAAAEWANQFGGRVKRALVASLSFLIFAAASAAVTAALVSKNYWLMLAPPIQAGVFYISHPASPIRKWVTLGGVASIILFIDFLFNGLPTAATLVAYGGLTFAAVRAAGFITNSSFRRALLSEEELFVAAYSAGKCSLRNNRTKQVYGVSSG